MFCDNHIFSLKSAKVGIYVPWKSISATTQDFLHPQPHQMVIKHLPATTALSLIFQNAKE